MQIRHHGAVVYTMTDPGALTHRVTLPAESSNDGLFEFVTMNVEYDNDGSRYVNWPDNQPPYSVFTDAKG